MGKVGRSRIGFVFLFLKQKERQLEWEVAKKIHNSFFQEFPLNTNSFFMQSFFAFFFLKKESNQKKIQEKRCHSPFLSFAVMKLWYYCQSFSNGSLHRQLCISPDRASRDFIRGLRGGGLITPVVSLPLTTISNFTNSLSLMYVILHICVHLSSKTEKICKLYP